MAAPAMTSWSTTPQPVFAIHQAQSAPAATDEDLVALAKMGDKTAFERLIERHYRFCLAKAYAILRNRGDAEDESQNAVAKAWQFLHQFHGDGTFGGWLSRIVSNECLMRIRERKGARLISVDELFESEGFFHLEVIDQCAVPEESVGDEEVSRMLNREINRVPVSMRKALIMRELHRCSMQEIAAHLGISVPAAKSRVMRARQALRVRLTERYGSQGCRALVRRSSRSKAAFVRA